MAWVCGCGVSVRVCHRCACQPLFTHAHGGWIPPRRHGEAQCCVVQCSAVQCSAVLCCAVQCCVQCACCSAVRVCDAVRVCAQRQRAACEGTSLSRWWCGGASPASGLLRHVTQSLVVQCNAMQCSGCAWCSAMQAGRCVVRARVCACLLVCRRVRVRRGRRG